MTTTNKTIALGVAGASGMIYAVRSLKFLLANDYTVELVASKGAISVWNSEHMAGSNMPSNPKLQEDFWRSQCDETKGNLTCHSWSDIGANIASGSFRTLGMVVIPCSMATVAKIAQGISSDLLERAADVHLKEGRKLIIVPRETPFSLIHLRNLTALAEAGAKIVPAIPAWYHQPQTINDLVDFVVARVFDQLDIDADLIKRWTGRWED